MGIRSRWRAAIGLLLLGLLPISAQAPATVAKVPARNGLIAFDRGQGEALMTIEADGTAERTLFEPGCCPRWSPDGRKLLLPYLTDDEHFTSAIAEADGSGLRALPPADATLNADGGVFSPDGAWIAVSGWDDTDPTRNGLYVRRSSDGGGLTLVTRNPTGDRDQHGDFSPDGEQVVFVRYNSLRTGERAIFTVKTDGTALRQITPWGMAGCCTASWSPDGRWILFDARGDLFIVHADGTGLRQIVLHPGSRHWAFEPAWSPDGSRIVFSMWVLALGQDDIYTARVDGSDLFQVTNTPDHKGQADWGAAP